MYGATTVERVPRRLPHRVHRVRGCEGDTSALLVLGDVIAVRIGASGRVTTTEHAQRPCSRLDAGVGHDHRTSVFKRRDNFSRVATRCTTPRGTFVSISASWCSHIPTGGPSPGNQIRLGGSSQRNPT